MKNSHKKYFVVAIDGPAGAGKGTIAKAVAKHFNFSHLDTGLLYRAVASKALQGNDPIKIARKFDESFLASSTLRTPRVEKMASQIAAMPAIRAALFKFQKSFAHQPGGNVLDGRDIGTVICPEADIKLFVTASIEARALRRYNELRKLGSDAKYKTVLRTLKERDVLDITRDSAPLIKAQDAYLLDTTELNISASVKAATRLVENAFNP